ncbi:Hypothetical_protein [Hexamita inflata]|uniref:Hypothetical_protein n=1 Tax=Hexamita inflata TaxID=28002 RepID=A0ABP1HF70_9EUKA
MHQKCTKKVDDRIVELTNLLSNKTLNLEILQKQLKIIIKCQNKFSENQIHDFVLAYQEHPCKHPFFNKFIKQILLKHQTQLNNMLTTYLQSKPKRSKLLLNQFKEFQKIHVGEEIYFQLIEKLIDESYNSHKDMQTEIVQIACLELMNPDQNIDLAHLLKVVEIEVKGQCDNNTIHKLFEAIKIRNPEEIIKFLNENYKTLKPPLNCKDLQDFKNQLEKCIEPRHFEKIKVLLHCLDDNFTDFNYLCSESPEQLCTDYNISLANSTYLLQFLAHYKQISIEFQIDLTSPFKDISKLDTAELLYELEINKLLTLNKPTKNILLKIPINQLINKQINCLKIDDIKNVNMILQLIVNFKINIQKITNLIGGTQCPPDFLENLCYYDSLNQTYKLRDNSILNAINQQFQNLSIENQETLKIFACVMLQHCGNLINELINQLSNNQKQSMVQDINKYWNEHIKMIELKLTDAELSEAKQFKYNYYCSVVSSSLEFQMKQALKKIKQNTSDIVEIELITQNWRNQMMNNAAKTLNQSGS